MAKSFKSVFNDLAEAVADVAEKKHTKTYGELAKNLVFDRTKKGYGSINGKRYKFEALDPDTVEQRRRGQLGSRTAPGKSNLTHTGEMLSDLRVKASKGEVIIDLASESSREKAEWNRKNGKEFMDLTKKEEKEVRELVKDTLGKLLNKVK